MISQENCFTRSGSPTGEPLPNSSRRIVSPIRHTAAPAIISLSVKVRPSRTLQLLVTK
jgi:hypothetical protein